MFERLPEKVDQYWMNAQFSRRRLDHRSTVDTSSFVRERIARVAVLGFVVNVDIEAGQGERRHVIFDVVDRLKQTIGVLLRR